MNLSELYNIALEMISDKKSNGFGFSANDNSTISVMISNDGAVFKASNGHIIENGQLKNTCSEYETITAMMKANKTHIQYLVTLDIESGNFVLPCGNCADLMVQINKENIYCNVMTNVNESVKLHTLMPNVSISHDDIEKTQSQFNDDWLDGWGDDFNETSNNIEPSTLEEQHENIYDDKPVAKKNPFESLPFFDDNPIPTQPTNTNNKKSSSYYQSKYLNSTPAPVSSYTSVSSIPVNSVTFNQFNKNNEITNKMRQTGLSENDKKDFNKQRLFNAFTVENVTNINGSQDTDVMVDIAEKQTLTKKELIKMAKEKKKMAKKDAKIVDASNKKR